jgi:hypothetical protein
MAGSLHAQNTPVMPSWLTVFPGAVEQPRQSTVLVESSYTAAARPHEVVDHYRRLFQAAHLPFRPAAMGYGFMIRASTDSCELSIQIRNQNTATQVRVTCAAIVGSRTNSSVTAQAEAAREQGVHSMEKYDQPVYPQPKKRATAQAWPAWLVHIQGTRLAIQQGGAGVLRSVYATSYPIATVQSFYADLLNANGYTVSSNGGASLPRMQRIWVEGAAYPDGRPGRRVVIRVEATAVSTGSSVQLRVIEFP